MDRIKNARARYANLKSQVDRLTAELASLKKATSAAGTKILQEIDDDLGTLFDKKEVEETDEDAG